MELYFEKGIRDFPEEKESRRFHTHWKGELNE